MLKFYKVDKDIFKVGNSYSFHIFLFDPERNKRIIDKYPGTVLTEEHIDVWNNFLEKGAFLQIFFEEKEMVFLECEIDEKKLENFNSFYFKMIRLQENRIKEFEEKANAKFLLRTEVNKIDETNNFMPLIERVRAEVMCFPLYENEFVSMATEIVNKLFVRDTVPVRVAAFAYLLAKQAKITDVNTLSELILACLLKDVGLSLIPTDKFKNYKELLHDDLYLKHPMLSIYLLSKSGVDFSKNIKRFILEHHEQFDGSGFPRQKKEEYIDISSMIINASDQIVLYHYGKITGRPQSLMKAIEVFSKGVPLEGLNVNVPRLVQDALSTLLLNDLDISTS